MTSDQKAIEQLISRWHAATAAGDLETVLSLMSKDAVFLVAGHSPMRGRSSFETGLRKVLTQNRIESKGEIQEVVVSGNLAYAWADLEVRIVPLNGDQATTRRGPTLSIFNKEPSGEWLLVRDANMLPPPK